MAAFLPPPGNPRIKVVDSFADLVATPFANGVNALCWPRELPGDFAAIVRALGPGDGLVNLDAARLHALALDAPGRVARDGLLADLHLLETQGLAPVLNCIHGYPPDDSHAPVATDVFSFHADSAPVEAATWLCTYHGAPSDGLRNEEAMRRIDVPATRAALLQEYGGADDEAFAEYLRDNCYDLHYAPLPSAQPYSFGIGHLWRIAIDWPGSAVPPCVHRAPATILGEPRLLLIS